jgi:5-methylcytosine-specific restriction enzyme subunit McrC
LKHNRQHITVFEHQSLSFDLKNDFERNLHKTLEQFFEKDETYYSLIRNGVRFKEYVGVIQIGNTLVEVLPKADKRKIDNESEATWRSVLINMLRAVHGFKVKAPSSTDLKVKNNSVLDLYFELFVNNVEYLLYRGLLKKYRKTQGNLIALKGSLQFSKQTSKNIVHKERFYTRYTTYDAEHLLHIILYQTILVLKRINTNASLIGRINALLLNFPEMPKQKITEAVFDKIIHNRKTMGYKNAIEIARLILLNYHPDLSKGRNDVLALMFDMNLLWEQFVLVSLKKEKSFKVRGQNSRYFWKPDGGNRRTIKPDITIIAEGENYVLDTKWKMLDKKTSSKKTSSKNPSIYDIRQMYAYHHYFNAQKVALLYPGNEPYVLGKFMPIYNPDKPSNPDNLSNKECGLMFTQYKDSVKNWQKQIGKDVESWIAKE